MKTTIKFSLFTVLLTLSLLWFNPPAAGQTTGWEPRTIATGIAESEFGNTTTETSIKPVMSGTNLIYRDYMKAGTVFNIAASGHIGTVTNNAANTLNIKVKAGSYTIANTGAIAVPCVTNTYWRLLCTITCRTNGATGALYANGMFELPSMALAQTNIVVFPITNMYGLTVSTLTNIALDVTGTFSISTSTGWYSTNHLATEQFVITASR